MWTICKHVNINVSVKIYSNASIHSPIFSICSYKWKWKIDGWIDGNFKSSYSLGTAC